MGPGFYEGSPGQAPSVRSSSRYSLSASWLKQSLHTEAKPPGVSGCDFSMPDLCRQRLAAGRVGAAPPSTHFYPSRLSGRLTQSGIRLWRTRSPEGGAPSSARSLRTRRYPRAPPPDSASCSVSLRVSRLLPYPLPYAFNSAPSGKTPPSRYLHRSINSRRATATIPMRFARPPPDPNRS